MVGRGRLADEAARVAAVLRVRRVVTAARRALALGGWPALRWAIRRPLPAEALGRRLRRFLEEGGATYVKLGQYLAIRRDLLPAEVCQELSRLFDEVPPLPAAVVERAVVAELGRPLREVFASFDFEPVGSASIAQVHRARTVEGDWVAVKVQRPSVEALIRADLANVRLLGRALDRLHALGNIRVVDLVDEFAEYTLREVDFLQEAATADAVRAETQPPAKVPEVYWALTTPRLLVAEFIDGVPLSEVVRLGQEGDPDPFGTLVPGADGDRVVQALAEACLHQLFVTGHFHGDPHPANILIEPQGVVVFVDFGIFGELTREQRSTLAAYVESLARGDVAGAYRHYATLVMFSDETDTQSYRYETMAVMTSWLQASRDPSAPVAEKITARYQGEMLDVMRHHGVRMQHDQLLFWRALAVLDATAHQLPVEFDLLAAVRRFFERRRPLLSALPRLDLATAFETSRLARRALGARPRVAAWTTRRGRSGGSAAAALALALGGLSLLLGVLVLTGALPGAVAP